MSKNPDQRLGGRVAIVGTGTRAAMYIRDIAARPSSKVVALCEPNSIRARYYNELLVSQRAPEVPVYQPSEFLDMLKKERVEVVVVTCVDSLHDAYIIPALEAGVRVLTEKPMTTNVEKCRNILEAVQRTGRHLTVTFNYRYKPVHELVKRTIAEGKIGQVSWSPFDLVNWWIDAVPETVAGFGRLAFYDDPFSIHLESDPTLKGLYADAEGEDGYYRDQNVFAPGIGIEDDMSVLVRYNTGATMTYHLTAYSPWEGYRVMFNGSHGRLELEVVESQYRSRSEAAEMSGLIHGTEPLPHIGDVKVTLQKLWEKPVQLPVEVDHGSHGGGDERMFNVLFGPLPGQSEEVGDASKQSANEQDGAMALAVGLLANESFRTGKFLDVKSLQLPFKRSYGLCKL
ncbi:NAD(P)-binding protein [Infundibulicybe gibba]|nr:NAD(P)-binding protein [Infundibulicybe gibba]